jgi:alkanesulfonate monooxygenase SsuD/methylene tetrahydromethanopterin reductase-like flavin-dependent oxidoreductase (luciferase family)
MVPVVIGRSSQECLARLARIRAIFTRVPEDAAGWREAGFLYGSPEAIVEGLRRWQALGIQRVMLQMLDMDDEGAIEAIARDVVPGLR